MKCLDFDLFTWFVYLPMYFFFSHSGARYRQHINACSANFVNMANILYGPRDSLSIHMYFDLSTKSFFLVFDLAWI